MSGHAVLSVPVVTTCSMEVVCRKAKYTASSRCAPRRSSCTADRRSCTSKTDCRRPRFSESSVRCALTRDACSSITWDTVQFSGQSIVARQDLSLFCHLTCQLVQETLADFVHFHVALVRSAEKQTARDQGFGTTDSSTPSKREFFATCTLRPPPRHAAG